MQDKDSAYKEISSLIERFEERIISNIRSEYNETLTRQELIDPFLMLWVGILIILKVTLKRIERLSPKSR
jgi:hypothetical protein